MVALIDGRATGALMLPAATPGNAASQVEAPAADKSRFGGTEEEEEETEEETPAEEPAAEETPDNPRAAKAPPQTDPKAAIARLRATQEKK
jgi:hypothetical protein